MSASEIAPPWLPPAIALLSCITSGITSFGDGITFLLLWNVGIATGIVQTSDASYAAAVLYVTLLPLASLPSLVWAARKELRQSIGYAALMSVSTAALIPLGSSLLLGSSVLVVKTIVGCFFVTFASFSLWVAAYGDGKARAAQPPEERSRCFGRGGTLSVLLRCGRGGAGTAAAAGGEGEKVALVGKSGLPLLEHEGSRFGVVLGSVQPAAAEASSGASLAPGKQLAAAGAGAPFAPYTTAYQEAAAARDAEGAERLVVGRQPSAGGGGGALPHSASTHSGFFGGGGGRSDSTERGGGGGVGGGMIRVMSTASFASAASGRSTATTRERAAALASAALTGLKHAISGTSLAVLDGVVVGAGAGASAAAAEPAAWQQRQQQQRSRQAATAASAAGGAPPRLERYASRASADFDADDDGNAGDYDGLFFGDLPDGGSSYGRGSFSSFSSKAGRGAAARGGGGGGGGGSSAGPSRQASADPSAAPPPGLLLPAPTPMGVLAAGTGKQQLPTPLSAGSAVTVTLSPSGTGNSSSGYGSFAPPTGGDPAAAADGTPSAASSSSSSGTRLGRCLDAAFPVDASSRCGRRTVAGVLFLTGFASGIMAGLVGSGGPPQLVAFTQLRLRKDYIRGVKVLATTVSNILRLVLFAVWGKSVFDASPWWSYVSVAAASFVGAAIGSWARQYVPGEALLKALYVLLWLSTGELFGAVKEPGTVVIFLGAFALWLASVGVLYYAHDAVKAVLTRAHCVATCGRCR